MNDVVVIDGDASIDVITDGEGQSVLVDNTGTFKHDELIHRDYPDQHPIEAITGLSNALSGKLDPSDLSIIYCGTATEVV